MEQQSQTEVSTAASDVRAVRPPSIRKFYLLCLPTFLGAVAFVLSFPIDRSIPFFPSVNIAETYGVWWVLVAPVFTIIAYVILMRGTWKARWSGKATALAWTTMILCAFLNILLAFGMIASTY